MMLDDHLTSGDPSRSEAARGSVRIDLVRGPVQGSTSRASAVAGSRLSFRPTWAAAAAAAAGTPSSSSHSSSRPARGGGPAAAGNRSETSAIASPGVALLASALGLAQQADSPPQHRARGGRQNRTLNPFHGVIGVRCAADGAAAGPAGRSCGGGGGGRRRGEPDANHDVGVALADRPDPVGACVRPCAQEGSGRRAGTGRGKSSKEPQRHRRNEAARGGCLCTAAASVPPSFLCCRP